MDLFFRGKYLREGEKGKIMAIIYIQGYCVRKNAGRWMLLRDNVLIDTFNDFDEAVEFINEAVLESEVF